MNHREARRKLHQPGTVEWLVGPNPSSTEFEDWLAGKTKHIWLYGIPGAGKTVLMSTVISSMLNLGPSRTRKTAVAYFYFSFRDSAKQITHNMLCSVLCKF